EFDGGRIGWSTTKDCGRRRAQIAAVACDKLLPGRFRPFETSTSQSQVPEMEGGNVACEFLCVDSAAEAFSGAASEGIFENLARELPAPGSGFRKNAARDGYRSLRESGVSGRVRR